MAYGIDVSDLGHHLNQEILLFQSFIYENRLVP